MAAIFSVTSNQLMHIYLNKIFATFYPDPIWNNRALGFLKTVTPQSEEQQEQRDE